MNYKPYGRDDNGEKVESRRSRKWDRNKYWVHNHSEHSKASRKARKDGEA